MVSELGLINEHVRQLFMVEFAQSFQVDTAGFRLFRRAMRHAIRLEQNTFSTKPDLAAKRQFALDLQRVRHERRWQGWADFWIRHRVRFWSAVFILTLLCLIEVLWIKDRYQDESRKRSTHSKPMKSRGGWYLRN
jgi:hypothetical protein